MKKIYIEPEFELLSIRLLADVLGPSQFETEIPVEEETDNYTEETYWDI